MSRQDSGLPVVHATSRVDVAVGVVHLTQDGDVVPVNYQSKCPGASAVEVVIEGGSRPQPATSGQRPSGAAPGPPKAEERRSQADTRMVGQTRG
jgi:hypothetical protein